jgi:hypothetical protein
MTIPGNHLQDNAYMAASSSIPPHPRPNVYFEQGRPNVYYFASPYSAPDVYTREKRYIQALMAAGELHKMGYCLIEPIGMSHHTAKVCALPTGYDHWKSRDRAFIDHSDGIIVLNIPGWVESVGVSDEIKFAFANNKPVWLYETTFKGQPLYGNFTRLDGTTYTALKGTLSP